MNPDDSRTRPSFVSWQSTPDAQEFPEDEVVRRRNLQRTMDRARESGGLRRRAQ